MRKVMVLTIMLLIAFTAQYVAWREQSFIVVTDEVLAGNPIQYYAPQGPAVGTVLVAHGFAANKTVMHHWGFFLAQQGFATFVFDQPGHGASRQALPVWRGPLADSPLGANLRAIIDELVQAGRASPGRIAVVGHSMGTTAAVAAAMSDPRIQATVAISSVVAEELKADHPANLLVMVAARDTPGVMKAVSASGRPAMQIPGRNHITIIYDPGVLQQASVWIHKSLGTQSPGASPVPVPWTWILVALVAALGSVVGAALLLAPGQATTEVSPTRVHPLTGLATLAVAALSAAVGCVYLRVPGLRVAVIDYILPYFLVMAAVLLFLRLIWPRDFAVSLSPESAPLLLSGLRGIGLFGGFAAVVGAVIHKNLSHFIPVDVRVVPVLVVAVGLWVYYIQEESLKRGMTPFMGFVIGMVGKLLILATWLGAASLPNPPGSLILVTPVAAVLMVGIEVFSLIFRSLGIPAAATATFAALVMAWSAAGTFPLL